MKYRMYCLSERHLSIAQKTIQAAHAIVEYSLKYGDTEEYKHWAEYDKTIIVLDGGTTNDMLEDIRTLSEIRHNYEIFAEPDMGNFVTSIAFLADERVWDKEKYPDAVVDDALLFIKGVYGLTDNEICKMYGGEANCVLRGILREKRLAS